MNDEEFIALQKEKKRKKLSVVRKESAKKKRKELGLEEKQEKKKTKKSSIPAVIIKEPTFDEVEASLKKNSGLISYTAQDLQCPTEVLKKIIKRNKALRNLLFDLRETILDVAEDTLLYRMREKQDGIVAMFVAKCLGKNRGWVEKPDKAGSSAQKPVFIRILPVDGGGAALKKKQTVEAKIQTAIPKVTKEEKDMEEIMEAEVMEE